MFWLRDYKLDKEPLKVVTSPLESKSMKTWLAFNPSERYAKVKLDHEHPNVALRKQIKTCLISWSFTQVFPKIGVTPNGWFMMENPIKSGWFGGTIIFGNTYTTNEKSSSNFVWSKLHFNGTPHPMAWCCKGHSQRLDVPGIVPSSQQQSL